MTLATLQKNSKKGRVFGDADVAGKMSGGKKSHKGGSKKRAAGVARPWTPVEDQLLCAIVHEFGSNWGLITDVFAASAPFKGVYRRLPARAAGGFESGRDMRRGREQEDHDR